MKRVLLDCDGVLSDFTSAVVELINQRFGSAFTPRDVKQFDFCAALNLHPKDATEVKRAIGETIGFAANLAVYEGAVEGLRKLREVADVYIVTSPWNSNPTWTSDREEWLWRKFKFPHARVIHTSAKYVCGGDVFVDDKTSAVERWHEAHGERGGLAVQWVTPHNRLERWDGRRTDSWDELVEWAR